MKKLLTKDPNLSKDLMRAIDPKLPKVDQSEPERMLEELQKELEARERLRKDDEKAQQKKAERIRMQEMLQ